MRKNVHVLIYSLVIILIAGCSDNSHKDLDPWLGGYTYSEKPVKAIAGYHMVMEWDLSINKINDDYKASLNVNGQQISMSLFNSLEGDAKTIHIIYDELIEGTDLRFQKGDTLFSLYKIGARLGTKWGALQPMLSESAPQSCNCFVFNGVNSHGNRIKIK